MPIIRDDRFETSGWHEEFPFSLRRPFFDATVLEFLHALSRAVLQDADARRFPDLVTFGYACRKSGLHALAQHYGNAATRTGWGTVVHITPSNIPVNFAFSLLFGLLSGNSNIVRMPSKTYPQNEIFLRLFDELIQEERFRTFATSIVFVQTGRDSSRLKEIIAAADGLIVWGGNATVAEFRSLPKKPRCVELYFPDRASSAIIDAAAYLALPEEARTTLARNFYNDTYLVDQNACSSPGLVFWLGKPSTIEEARKTFWPVLQEELVRQDYQLDTVARLDKLIDLMGSMQVTGIPIAVKRHSNDIWITDRSSPKEARLRFGMFAEIDILDLKEVAAFLRPQEQTLTYSGADPHSILAALQHDTTSMVDRIVPIGKALDINPFWDGKDILSLMSRRIDIVAA